MRVQSREDGRSSTRSCFRRRTTSPAAPGALKNDTTIVPHECRGTVCHAGAWTVRAAGLARPPRRVLWATRQSGTADVRVTDAAGARHRRRDVAPARAGDDDAGSRYDYYQHEARLTGLTPATRYTYDPFVSGVDVRPGRHVPHGAVERHRRGAVRRARRQRDRIDRAAAADRQSDRRATRSTSRCTRATSRTARPAAPATRATARTRSWFFSVYSRGSPAHGFFPAEGNHDSRPSNGDGTAYWTCSRCRATARLRFTRITRSGIYSFDYGPVHFVALDTEFAFQDVNRAAPSSCRGSRPISRRPRSRGRSPTSTGRRIRPAANMDPIRPCALPSGRCSSATACSSRCRRTTTITSAASRCVRAPSGSAVTYVVTGGGGGPLYAVGTSVVDGLLGVAPSLRARDGRYLHADARGRRPGRRSCSTAPHCRAARAAAAGGGVVRAPGDQVAGAWRVEADATAAGGKRIRHPDAGAAKVTTARSASPAHYFELTFNARGRRAVPPLDSRQGGQQLLGERFRLRAVLRQRDHHRRITIRIGTSSAATVNIEDCSGCGVSGWGWQDNGYGAGVLGPEIYFATSGAQTHPHPDARGRSGDRPDRACRPSRFLAQSPGALKNDTTILTPQ